MSSENIPDRSGGSKILAEWFNLLKRVVSQDVVPRNSSGTATDAGGSLGTSSLNWANIFAQAMKLKSSGVSRHITLAAPASIAADFTLTMISALPAGGLKRLLRIDSSGNFSVGSARVESSSCGNDTGSGGPTDITNLSVDYTSNGNPVQIALVPDGTTNQSYIQESVGDSVTIRFLKNGTVIAEQIHNWGTSGVATLRVPVSAFSTEDTPAASGTPYTYKAQISANTWAVRYAKLVVREVG